MGDEEDEWSLEVSGTSTILSLSTMSQLSLHFPPRLSGCTWQLLFSTDRNGFSLNSVYRCMDALSENAANLIAVRDTNDCRFGALLSHRLRVSEHVFGNGQSFLFSVDKDPKQLNVWKWTGANDLFVLCSNQSLAIGMGDGHFGLYVDGDLNHGRSERCVTYANDPLTPTQDFVIRTLEIWVFQ